MSSRRKDKDARRPVKARDRKYVSWLSIYWMGWIKLADALLHLASLGFYPSDMAGTYAITLQMAIHDANFGRTKRGSTRRSRK